MQALSVARICGSFVSRFELRASIPLPPRPIELADFALQHLEKQRGAVPVRRVIETHVTAP
jgi:hypothetical protein